MAAIQRRHGSALRRTVVAALAVALAGCPLKATTTTTTTTPVTAGRSISAGAGAGGGDTAPGASGGTRRATVPDLMGKTADEARALVKAAGFVHAPESTLPLECVDAAQDAGLINCQDPEPGKSLEIYQLIKINVYRPQVISGAIVRRQLATLHGLTPDQAKQELKKLGHDGKVHVRDVTNYGGGHTYVKECGENKVCYTSSESGIGLHDELTLFINPTLKIAPPPD
jgi:hypothetical protein